MFSDNKKGKMATESTSQQNIIALDTISPTILVSRAIMFCCDVLSVAIFPFLYLKT